jgi:hypothetical protein
VRNWASGLVLSKVEGRRVASISLISLAHCTGVRKS